MTPPRHEPHGHSLVLRAALWSWLVTLVTLLIYATAILPQQQSVFSDNLRSKAYGLMLSLREVAAGSIVNDDFTSGIDHATEILKGDPILDYVILTRKDGKSVVAERSGWRFEPNLGPEWRPSSRTPSSGIGVVPLFNRRVFHYSHPLDYLNIELGWIHIGLSLDTYDQNRSAVLRQTAQLAALCGLLSLAASAFYAARLARPILSLRSAVQRIADGHLTTRIAVTRNDEVGTLARSVNTMAEALQRRDRILETVRFAAQEFLTTPNWMEATRAVLAQIAAATQGGCTHIYQLLQQPDGTLQPTPLFSGCSGSKPPTTSTTSTTPPSLHPHTPEPTASSPLTIPIRSEGSTWGFLRLDEGTSANRLTDIEQDSLRAIADMLGATIARHRAQDAWLEATQTLEQRVEERTRALRERAEAEAKARTELAQTQQRLIETSRFAGMAEVATSVLHNVGNVLNSVGVSATLVTDRLRQSKIANLGRASALLREHRPNLVAFLTENPKGRVLPDYLEAVCSQIVTENSQMLDELTELGQNIEHIKKIVAMQQTYAKVSGTVEETSVSELVDDAIRLNAASLQANRITLLRNLPDHLPTINVDRHRVLQILTNLLRNAKQALDPTDSSQRRIEISAHLGPHPSIVFKVRDNGVGIPPENITRIFQHGFTTKKEGHGFGLHSGANVAREMGGRLTAHSDGPGLGAEFTLELPLAPRQSAHS